MSNLNPQNKFQKGNKQASKKLGQPNLMTREQHQVGVELDDRFHETTQLHL